jgi:L-fuconate dehydratase
VGVRITDLAVRDVRFPTSDFLDGSDAMNPDPDYSAAYAELATADPGLRGRGMTFTIGRGTEICAAAIEAFRPLVVGLDRRYPPRARGGR